jgi:hypothetical protein
MDFRGQLLGKVPDALNNGSLFLVRSLFSFSARIWIVIYGTKPMALGTSETPD